MIIAALLVAAVSSAISAAPVAMVRHVAAWIPVQGGTRALEAVRPFSPAVIRSTSGRGSVNAWQFQQTLPGAVIHDIAFPSESVGYAAAELGQVWKTIDGGDHWTRIMNLGFPYYWYGVAALDVDNLVISGFDDQNSLGILRWSHDGGQTWSDDVV
ncbi:MAG TPA: hypothetical protein VGO25_04810, partial [Rhodanobacteraceae bacterium]|nr:hypothetical protein [Rhodanobacteraceae bacterium]